MLTTETTSCQSHLPLSTIAVGFSSNREKFSLRLFTRSVCGKAVSLGQED